MKKMEKRKASKFTTKIHSKRKRELPKGMKKISGGVATYWVSGTLR